MALGKQAKILTNKQIEAVYQYLGTTRNGLRNQVIFLLSVKAGLRAKEIAELKWMMVTDSDGNIGSEIHLTDAASKGRGGRVIPMNRHLREKMAELFKHECRHHDFDLTSSHVIRTERAPKTTPQAIVNMFAQWYADIGFIGCSSHSGRRTFITNAAKKISSVGGSVRDVQILAGHSSLVVTQRYIDDDVYARRKIVDLL